MAGLRSLVGGEIHEYTHLLEDTRSQAVDRLAQNARVMGPTAVVMMPEVAIEMLPLGIDGCG